jgi:DNA ligase-associated metallophosphoesterase
MRWREDEALAGTETLARRLDGVQLELCGDRSLFLPETASLVVSDLHLGKSESFQRRGLGVPAGDDDETIRRLSAAVKRTEPAELLLLGDLYHEPDALTRERREALLRRLLHAAGDADLQVVLGNHDRGLMEMLARAGAGLHQILDHHTGLLLTHAPPELRGAPRAVVCGHLHPVARLTAPGERLRLPCFHLTADRLVLPAFGSFTGGRDVDPAAAGERIAAWKGALIPAGPKT